MVENGVLDIMYLNKNNPSPALSSSDKEKKNFDNFKISFTDDYPKKNAEILSGQYGINLLLVGLSLMLALSYQGSAVKEEHILSFLISLMTLQITWMLWYIIRKDRQKCFVSEKDSDAGTSWLRGGLTLLALISLIMDAFRIGYYVGYKTCLSPAVGVYPVIHAVHTISQFWILPAFGCRPQFDNGMEEKTFGYTIWTTIVNVAMPLNLFYRMHSVASLFEVFRKV
ncbi:UNVERIFIED_CONTAM: hypothetical protein FKN15_063380 [Acipenser sinensis]